MAISTVAAHVLLSFYCAAERAARHNGSIAKVFCPPPVHVPLVPPVHTYRFGFADWWVKGVDCPMSQSLRRCRRLINIVAAVLLALVIEAARRTTVALLAAQGPPICGLMREHILPPQPQSH